LLFHLQSLKSFRETKKGQLHKVFKVSFDASHFFRKVFVSKDHLYTPQPRVREVAACKRFC
jgi:hypothetical protein